MAKCASAEKIAETNLLLHLTTYGCLLVAPSPYKTVKPTNFASVAKLTFLEVL
jgi:hypothetical protein